MESKIIKALPAERMHVRSASRTLNQICHISLRKLPKSPNAGRGLHSVTRSKFDTLSTQPKSTFRPVETTYTPIYHVHRCVLLRRRRRVSRCACSWGNMVIVAFPSKIVQTLALDYCWTYTPTKPLCCIFNLTGDHKTA